MLQSLSLAQTRRATEPPGAAGGSGTTGSTGSFESVRNSGPAVGQLLTKRTVQDELAEVTGVIRHCMHLAWFTPTPLGYRGCAAQQLRCGPHRLGSTCYRRVIGSAAACFNFKLALWACRVRRGMMHAC